MCFGNYSNLQFEDDPLNILYSPKLRVIFRRFSIGDKKHTPRMRFELLKTITNLYIKRIYCSDELALCVALFLCVQRVGIYAPNPLFCP